MPRRTLQASLACVLLLSFAGPAAAQLPIPPIDTPSLSNCAIVQAPALVCVDADAIKCWGYWDEDTSTSCTDSAGSTETMAEYGVYYCPPAGVHADCTDHGTPSDGTIDVCGYKSGQSCSTYEDASFGWSYVCSEGACTSGGPGFVNTNDFKIVKGQITHGIGTYGGWANKA